MTTPHILVVEDDPKIARLIKDYLENGGYRATILNRGDEALAQIRKSPPDLVVLDIMLPGKDGMEICRETRKFSTVPIIMLTARVEEIDRLLGLELGADDYIAKPFSPREVVARVKAVLRRSRPEPEPGEPVITAGPIRMDTDRRQATVNDSDIQLTPSEFELLKILITHPGRVFSRNDLIARVQGYDFEGYDRTIDSHIKNLRKKIDACLPTRKIIRTIYGVGYAFHNDEQER